MVLFVVFRNPFLPGTLSEECGRPTNAKLKTEIKKIKLTGTENYVTEMYVSHISNLT